jgi:hypothetical protein
VRRYMTVVAVVWLLVPAAGCGTASRSSVTTVPVPTTSTGASTTTTARQSALEGIGPFLAAAGVVDARLRSAAAAVNARVTGTTVVLDQATTAAIGAADPASARDALPAGLPPDLERAVLVVYNDLVSRRSAFNGVLRNDSQDQLPCLRNGAAPAARFAADLAAARRLAAATPGVAPVAPDSRAAEELAVRFAWIDGVNNGCASCGGMVIRELVPITFYGSPTVPSNYDRAFDGVIQGVYFNAGYTPGTGWVVVLNAC